MLVPILLCAFLPSFFPRLHLIIHRYEPRAVVFPKGAEKLELAADHLDRLLGKS
jgi:hypothetical protein